MDNQRAIQLLQAHIDAEDMPLFSQAAAMGIRALERVAALEAELAEARKDGERLNALERLAEENSIGGLLIHHQHSGNVKWTGVGLGLSRRTLRAAIDAARAAEGGEG